MNLCSYTSNSTPEPQVPAAEPAVAVPELPPPLICWVLDHSRKHGSNVQPYEGYWSPVRGTKVRPIHLLCVRSLNICQIQTSLVYAQTFACSLTCLFAARKCDNLRVRPRTFAISRRILFMI
ncbi:Hypothetical predicted protein [Pelobates cultripes]|uniref:Uncharacterized protein n=1 Tax=Pelobates cultripes TaxID=61616 RepID=A0AAD1WME2_PELCU|nr:Hypothetical predicted protein [Pelobates cultripes]